ncbi:AAA-ATPase ASD, mitochondrial [Vitis vinifera]|uniref:AAA-ATPase ASD, mitochondrial n=1 Tax=Vitis vinifera TaxID=29760 RepID=A0A438CKE4_VITVI|nr:AAA-ATPase ASD, mitochondrial [Vitis vinifera]
MNEKQYYLLTFHKKHRDLITTEYLSHVLTIREAIKGRTRQRKLYTNNRLWLTWSHVAKDFYARVGKSWKQGYLLYGLHGMGKSTMIAAMENMLLYDIYDLELMAVGDNTELRKLLMQISSKSITMIEDINFFLDLMGQRKKMKKNKAAEEEEKDPIKDKVKVGDSDEGKTSKVTLSGLLNFIGGLWSASEGERLIVFTTNYMEKLDPTLIWRGRMDKHIELSYCNFESFKNTSVANTKTNLKSLVQALEMAKEEAMLKVKKEGKEKESSTRKEDQ